MRYSTSATGRRRRTHQQRRGICARCQRERNLHTREHCEPCRRTINENWTRNPPAGAGVERTPEAVTGRIDDYAELRSRGYTIRQAAERLRIHSRTAQRYEARLLAAGAIKAGDALRLPATYGQEAA